MYLTIFEAIEKRLLLQFHYDGHFRIVEPHMYGSDASGIDLLCGFQIAGMDGLGKRRGWNKFEASKLMSLQCLPTLFAGPRHPYRLHSETFKRIYCQVTSPSLERARAQEYGDTAGQISPD